MRQETCATCHGIGNQCASTWTKASSDTECDKQENAERMIRDAINAYSPLASRDIKIIPQGSYRNNTNVRQESDVDICVCCMDPFFDDYSMAGYGRASRAVDASYYPYAQFKNEVGAALVNKFGAVGVHRGDKHSTCMLTPIGSMRTWWRHLLIGAMKSLCLGRCRECSHGIGLNQRERSSMPIVVGPLS